MASNSNKKKTIRVRNIPYNEELEKSVLAAIMTDSRVAVDYIGMLDEKTDFYVPKHKAIFEEIKKRLRENNAFDYTAIISSSTMDSLDNMGGIAYVSEVVTSFISSANIEQDINQLKSVAQSRKMIEIADNISQKAYNNEASKDIVSYAQDAVVEVANSMVDKDLTHIGAYASEVLDEILDIKNSGKMPVGISTGFSNLDEIANGGFLPGQMIVLAARPGCGKTSFAMNIVANIAQKDKDKVLAVFNLEMSASELIKRLYSTYALVDSKLLSKPLELHQEDIVKLLKVKGNVISSNIHIDDSANITVEDIMFKCKKLKAKTGRLDLILIDHMQLINSKKPNRYEQMTDISRMIKIMAKELEVPVLVLSQMSRNIEKEDVDGKPKEPKMSDLRESGAIEQDADMILFLVPGNFNLPDETQLKVPLDVLVAKNRSGEAGCNLHYSWEKDKMLFKPLKNVIAKIEKENKQEDKKSNEDYDDNSSNQNIDYEYDTTGLEAPEDDYQEGLMADLQNSAYPQNFNEE